MPVASFRLSAEPLLLQIPYLTFWEVVHYWFHAACEVLVANDYTRKIGQWRGIAFFIAGACCVGAGVDADISLDGIAAGDVVVLVVDCHTRAYVRNKDIL